MLLSVFIPFRLIRKDQNAPIRLIRCIVMFIGQSNPIRTGPVPLLALDVFKSVISSFGPKISFTNSRKAPGRCGKFTE